MLAFILSVVVLLFVGGCACVFWTARGGAPRWARGVAKATLFVSDLARSSSRGSRSQRGSSGE
ncbi:hypothetical protein M4V62_42680 [Streptomyces durmitorensis]|uniref:Secreted protein n=1 Tax=Streptomyces durmitorensis TaxID=319947 RepID=A0ABY4Q4V2_9ACTN|nr:hypothetical protein [Streptomyces durmitorensis]UQT61245.1 hypothetical protein M4V62_42680 [Streptomyces durmitorensis]